MGAAFAWDLNAPEKAFLSKRIASGDTVYDVGGNRGQFTLLFSHLVGEKGTVVAFEPVEKLANTIRRNLSLNSISNTCVVAAAAAGSNGTAEFKYTDERSTQGMLGETEPSYQLSSAETIEVQTVRLDHVVRERGKAPPDLMKIDVEGGAGVALAGAERLLEAYEPDVYIELHGPEERQAVQDQIIGRGYTARTLDGTRVEDPSARTDALWCTT
jgi:FkbM family methyltransferase